MSQSLLPVGLISLVFNLGGGLASAALPLYARELGADYRDLGLIGASHGIAFALLTVPLGRASDRLGRRRLLLFAALAGSAAAACYLLATHVAGLIAGKLIEAMGAAAFWPALEAWVAESFGRRAGTAVGVGYSAYAAAYVVGTSAAGFVIEATGVRVSFALYLGTALATLPLVLALTAGGEPGPHTSGATSGATAGPPPARDPDTTGARQQRLLTYATGFVYVFGLGTVMAFLPVYAVDRGLGPRSVGLLLASYWMARLFSALAAGRLSDRWGRRAILVPALFLSAVSALLLAMPAGPAALFAGTAGLGLAAGACGPACVGHLADHARPAERGIVMGLFEGACGLSFIVSGFAGGHTAEAVGPEVPYILVSALALGWAAVLARQLPRGPVRFAV